MIRCNPCFRKNCILVEADTHVWVEFENSAVRQTYICKNCNPFDTAKDIIEKYHELPGSHTATINWMPMCL